MATTSKVARYSAAKRLMMATATSFAIASAFVPGTAHAGFLEQLFGGMAAPEPQPAAPPPAYYYGDPADTPRAPEVRRRRIAEVHSNKQTPTDLMHDKTLQIGDAVMMKSGLHVYEGPEAKTHDTHEFVALDDATDLSKKERAMLVAIDTTRNDPLRGNTVPDTLSSGRSAAVSTPISAGYRITDARGHSIRYVGP